MTQRDQLVRVLCDQTGTWRCAYVLDAHLVFEGRDLMGSNLKARSSKDKGGSPPQWQPPLLVRWSDYWLDEEDSVSVARDYVPALGASCLVVCNCFVSDLILYIFCLQPSILFKHTNMY
jgi:hypothetical protein